jgi:hypothetical protein
MRPSWAAEKIYSHERIVTWPDVQSVYCPTRVELLTASAERLSSAKLTAILRLNAADAGILTWLTARCD